MSDDPDVDRDEPDDIQIAAFRMLIDERKERIQLTPGQVLALLVLTASGTSAFTNPTARDALWLFVQSLFEVAASVAFWWAGLVIFGLGFVMGYLAGEEADQ